MNKILAAGRAAILLGALASPGVAQTAAPLLDPSLQGRLERWLGAGPLHLENVYTRQAGDDALDFHAAADGRGSNFTLTYHWPDHGPTFGAGPDLFVEDLLTTSISWQLSYGDPAFEGRSIIDGSYGGQFRRVDALEVYAISLVPEPRPLALLATGLALIGFSARRRWHSTA